MSYKVTDNTNSFKSSIQQKASIFLRLMAENIVNISEKKTPKKEGNLRRDVLKQVLGLNGKIVWSKNYAAKMEEIQFRNYTTPGTGPHYAQNAVEEGVKKTSIVAKSSGLSI